ncbi:MAG: HD domain-containing protein [Deltaproteobacteria bacterium]|nr:HD domain-containing protein [Deltaproteobacteria bacterium]
MDLKQWFNDYVRSFSSDDLVIRQNMDLKAGHTRRVCEAIVDIGMTLNLSEEDLGIAEISALLHDIGRFEQYLKYRTFSDQRSENHAEIGVKVLKENHVLNSLNPDTADIIIKAVKFHNRASLPEGEGERCLFFLKLLRDADKLDIWHVVTEYYRNKDNERNHALELDLPDTEEISEPIYNSLIHGRLARTADLRTLNDFKLLQIGWIYDLNFSRTFQIVRDNGYLETIRDVLPSRSSRVKEIYELARAHLERNCPGQGCSR